MVYGVRVTRYAFLGPKFVFFGFTYVYVDQRINWDADKRNIYGRTQATSCKNHLLRKEIFEIKYIYTYLVIH